MVCYTLHIGVGCSYNQVADEDLDDLSTQAGATMENLVQDPDEKVAEGGADKGTVGSHLWHARREVVAVLVAVLSKP